MPSLDPTKVDPVALAARLSRRHSVVMPDQTRHDCANYQEAWMRRNAEAWAAGLAPLEIPIVDENDEEVVP